MIPRSLVRINGATNLEKNKGVRTSWRGERDYFQTLGQIDILLDEINLHGNTIFNSC